MKSPQRLPRLHHNRIWHIWAILYILFTSPHFILATTLSVRLSTFVFILCLRKAKNKSLEGSYSRYPNKPLIDVVAVCWSPLFNYFQNTQKLRKLSINWNAGWEHFSYWLTKIMPICSFTVVNEMFPQLYFFMPSFSERFEGPLVSVRWHDDTDCSELPCYFLKRHFDAGTFANENPLTCRLWMSVCRLYQRHMEKSLWIKIGLVLTQIPSQRHSKINKDAALKPGPGEGALCPEVTGIDWGDLGKPGALFTLGFQ